MEGHKKAKDCPECRGFRGEWRFDARGANTALQLMGKDRGMFVEKVQIIDDELANKTPEEVQEMVKSMALELGRDFVQQLAEAVGIFEPPTTETLPPEPNAEVPSTVN